MFSLGGGIRGEGEGVGVCMNTKMPHRKEWKNCNTSLRFTIITLICWLKDYWSPLNIWKQINVTLFFIDYGDIKFKKKNIPHSIWKLHALQNYNSCHRTNCTNNYQNSITANPYIPAPFYERSQHCTRHA